MSTSAPPASSPAPSATAGSASSTWWRAVLALLLVFVAGAGIGYGIGTHVGRGPRRGPRDGMLLDGGPIGQYQLSAAQRTRIDSVLTARRGEIDGFWRGPGQALRSILDSTRADVRAVLNPDQRARFDSAHAQHERRMRGRFGPLGRPPGPPAPPRPGTR